MLTRDNLDENTPDDVIGNGQQEPEEPTDSEKPEDTEEPEDESDIAVGKPAPDFIYKDRDSKEVQLTNLAGDIVKLEDYKGKIVLLNFWGTWCKWCDVEMPDLDRLDKENDDLVVLAVNVQEDRETVQKYIDEGGYEFEVVMDMDGQIAKKYLVSSFPTSYFLDEEGLLIGGISGMMEYEQMVEALNIAREGVE